MSETSESLLHQLAEAAGLVRQWEDVHRRIQTVSDASLAALLEAMGLECGSEERLECSLRRLREETTDLEGRLIIVHVGEPIVIRHSAPARYRIEYEAGVGGREGEVQALGGGQIRIAPVDVVGYHHLRLGRSELTLAVAPRKGVAPPEAVERPWGVAAQLYSLRRAFQAGDNPVLQAALGAGDYGALAELATRAGQQGADAVAISPVHALFSADPARYSPYAPSSRLFLNTAYLDVLALGEDALRDAVSSMGAAQSELAMASASGPDLIHWPAVQTTRLAVARALFEHFEKHGPQASRKAFEAFRVQGGDALLNHCLYEVLHAHYAESLGAAAGWQDWPAPMRDCNSAAAQAFARQSARDVRFHAFMQWLADEGMRKAQEAAKSAGMTIGLIADLAIGTDARGSQAWCSSSDLLQGATVGAAPDLYYPEGQNWGLTAFSPRALHEKGFAPFLNILRHALSHAGGVRIDHVLGLARMWLVPEGGSAAEGAFLRYPLEDMLRLLALESHRHQAIVVGENLGTVPAGFNDLLSDHGVLGTSVLWFEREEQAPQRFVQSSQWPVHSMATTTTHDLPTVAGWWAARDIDWQRRLGKLDAEALKQSLDQRAQDKILLAEAVDMNASDEGEAPVARVVGWVASGASPLCVFPLEDFLELPEQPNLPGTCGTEPEDHPNWMRRLPIDVDRLFDSDPAAKIVNAVRLGRRQS